MAKKLVSGPILAPTKICSWILPLLHVRHCCKLSMYAISRKTNEPNFRKCQKTKFRHVQYQKKLMMQSWENLVTDGGTEGRTDGKTDGQTDESDFIGHCPTNVDRPTYFLIKLPSVKFLLKSTHPLCQTNH